MFSVLLFPVLFLLLSALCLWIVIGCKGWWQAKFWLINLVCLFSIVIYFSISSYMGWPSSENMPHEMRLYSFVSNEPECLYVLGEQHGESKEILGKVFGYHSSDKVRLFKIPYNEDLHRDLEQAMERVNSGAYVIMSKNRVMDAEEIKKFGKTIDMLDGLQKLNGGSGPNDNQYQLYVLPLNKLIKKPTD